MTKIDRVLSELSKLYEFNRNIRNYKVKKKGPLIKKSSKKTEAES